MDNNQDSQDRSATPQRRVKVTGATAHRTGVKREGIKPHKRTVESMAKQTITTFLAGVKTGSLSQTYWGETLDKNAAALRANFGLAANDELYLLHDPTATGRAGMLLAASGLHLADGRGGTQATSWNDFASAKLGYQRGMLTIGQSGITSRDGQALLSLLQQIQAKIAQ